MPSRLGTARRREGSDETRRTPPTGRAHRACEKCTRTKKKCDKALPACSRCSRLAATCCYDFVYTGPSLTIIDQCLISGPGGAAPGEQTAAGAGTGAGAAAAAAQQILQLVNLVQPEAVMALLAAANVDWHDSVDHYFRSVHPWLSIIHPARLAANLDSAAGEGPQRPELALLLVCMHLMTEAAPTSSPRSPQASGPAGDARGMFSSPIYLGARRVLGLLRASMDPCIELVQCGILLGLYEFGHGEYQRAYVSIGDANSFAQILKLGPGSYVCPDEKYPVSAELEEQRNVYWGLFIVDRLIHVECRLMWMPLHVPSPKSNDLLPGTSLECDDGLPALSRARSRSSCSKSSPFHQARYPVSVEASIPLGVFQRVAQCGILLDKALEWDKGTCGPGGLPGMDSFSDIDVQARALIAAMVCEEASRVGEYYACFATGTCVLLLVYCRFLCTIDLASIHSQSSNVEVAKAIAGINYTVDMIVNANVLLNAQLARSPDLLDTTSPVTAYAAYHSLRVLINFDHIITGARSHFRDIYSSIHFFGKKWAVADHLVDRLETFIHDKDKEPDQFYDPSSTDESDPGIIALE
jgi:hypothetical protein